MAGKAAQYRCSECGHSALTWTGQCSGCGAWNSLEQVSARAGGSGRRGMAKGAGGPKPVPLRDVQAERSARVGTGIAELDRVLGGGLVPGSLVLLGGAPGIGKSTLAGMALANIGAAGNEVIYVSGEESAAQVRRRAERLGEAALSVPMLAEPSLESVLSALESERPAACVIDSVQTLAIPDAAPGSVGAIREATSALLETAKRLDVTLILIGHVTKEGSLAGPRALEHLVDCVLHFEGERERTFRTLRALKNRFGATSEVGVFEMRQGGLVEVTDPSARFVGESRPAAGLGRPLCDGGVPARCWSRCRRWSRRPRSCLLAAQRPASIGTASRWSSRSSRGMRASPFPQPTSSSTLRAGSGWTSLAPTSPSPWPSLPPTRAGPSRRTASPLACFGEIGLTGEIRYVPHADRRVAEARKFGLGKVLGPPAADEPIRGLVPVSSLKAAISGGTRGSLKRVA